MSDFLVALQFLSRLPSPIRRPISLEEMGRSIVWFPLVGLVLGALVAGLDRLLEPVLARPARDALAVWAMVALTGALHLDGLVDACDGLLAFKPPEVRLAIMHESHAGGFGAAAALALLLLKFAAVGGLPPHLRPIGLLLAPALGRWAIVYGYTRYPYARSEPGVSLALKQAAVPWRFALATATAGGACLAVLGPPGLLLLLLALLLATLAAGYVLSRIPGMTGDTHGAVAEGVETLTLVALPLVAASAGFVP